MVNVILALDALDGFGYQNTIPWKSSRDMKRFSSLTRGGVVIMGRNTWESLGKPLRDRVNIVVSSGKVKDVEYFPSLEEALLFTQQHYPEKEVWLIGGVGIFREAFESDMVSRIYLTRFKSTFEVDIHFSLTPYLKYFKLAERQEEEDLVFETYILW